MSRSIRAPVLPCVYCGRPGHGLACRDHRDLLRLDPHYVFSTSRGPFIRTRKAWEGCA